MMRILVSRVKEASVAVENEVIGKCSKGLLVLSCFEEGDSEKEIEYLARKCANLRIFDDEAGIMNKSVVDISGSILSISQFTLYADASKGNRPSYIRALGGDRARRLYDLFNEELNKYIHTETGSFGADMQITAHHDGPVNIIIDSK